MSDNIVELPGLCDVHVHFREPGFGYKETIRTGSEAALAGGFTTVCAMPNLSPAPDTPEHLEEQLAIIRRDAVIDVVPYATITIDRKGRELVDYEALAPLVAGFSDDGSGVQDEGVMREAMSRIAATGKVLAAHCEVNSLLRGGYIHDGEYCRRNGHKGICSESEWREIERDIRLSADTGCRLHVCHISTAESVALIRDAKKDGLNVSCETGPHYLAFCDEDLLDEGRFKMNPPIRSARDREALLEGIADGTIEVIATDHAPHSAEEKSRGLKGSAMGVVGLETSFAACNTFLVRKGVIPLPRLIDLMARNPRRIFGLSDPGRTFRWDLDEPIKVSPAGFKSMGRSTPFDGMTLYGKLIAD